MIESNLRLVVRSPRATADWACRRP
jgi:hypothetical protein